MDSDGTVRSAQVQQPWPRRGSIMVPADFQQRLRPVAHADLPAEWHAPPTQQALSAFATKLGCDMHEVGCAAVISMPEHPVTVAWLQSLQTVPSDGILGGILQNFDDFLAAWGLEATDGTIMNIIYNGQPSLLIERSAWVEREQPNPRYPPLRR